MPVDRHERRCRHAEAFTAEAVELLDTVFGVPPVAAHVPFADGTRLTRHRIGTPDNADREIAAAKAALRWCLEHTAKRFVAKHEALAAGWWRPVQPGQDLPVRTTHADGDRFDESFGSGSGAPSSSPGSTSIASIIPGGRR